MFLIESDYVKTVADVRGYQGPALPKLCDIFKIFFTLKNPRYKMPPSGHIFNRLDSRFIFFISNVIVKSKLKAL